MKIVIDLGICQGYGNCVTAAPDFFDLDDSGLARLLRATADTPQEQAAVRDAISLCPMSAISLDDED